MQLLFVHLLTLVGTRVLQDSVLFFPSNIFFSCLFAMLANPTNVDCLAVQKKPCPVVSFVGENFQLLHEANMKTVRREGSWPWKHIRVTLNCNLVGLGICWRQSKINSSLLNWSKLVPWPFSHFFMLCRSLEEILLPELGEKTTPNFFNEMLFTWMLFYFSYIVFLLGCNPVN